MRLRIWQIRGRPEAAMLEVQKAAGSGTLSFIVEHGGDLTHRMSEKPDFLQGSPKTVRDKAEKVADRLDPGFGTEMMRNLRSNADFSGVDENEYISRVFDELEQYSREHFNLTVYNELQYKAKMAAVLLGNKSWGAAGRHFAEIARLARDEDEYTERALEYELDSNGRVIPYDRQRG